MSPSEHLKPSSGGEVQKKLVPVTFRIIERNRITLRTNWTHGTITPHGRFVDFGELTDPHHYDPFRDRIVWEKERQQVEPARRGRPAKPKHESNNETG
jgi:hypothetical protein